MTNPTQLNLEFTFFDRVMTRLEAISSDSALYNYDYSVARTFTTAPDAPSYPFLTAGEVLLGNSLARPRNAFMVPMTIDLWGYHKTLNENPKNLALKMLSDVRTACGSEESFTDLVHGFSFRADVGTIDDFAIINVIIEGVLEYILL